MTIKELKEKAELMEIKEKQQEKKMNNQAIYHARIRGEIIITVAEFIEQYEDDIFDTDVSTDDLNDYTDQYTRIFIDQEGNVTASNHKLYGSITNVDLHKYYISMLCKKYYNGHKKRQCKEYYAIEKAVKTGKPVHFQKWGWAGSRITNNGHTKWMDKKYYYTAFPNGTIEEKK